MCIEFKIKHDNVLDKVVENKGVTRWFQGGNSFKFKVVISRLQPCHKVATVNLYKVITR